MASHAWHEFPPPAPGSRAARRVAWSLALGYAAGTALYAVASVFRELGSLCLPDPEDRAAPDCPPPVAAPEEWLVTARWGAWSIGALAILFALVLAGQSVQGRRPARHAWTAMAVAVVAGIAFSALAVIPRA